MKKTLLICACVLNVFNLSAQTEVNITPDGIFDRVYDAGGNSYALNDLNVLSSKPMGSTGTVNAAPTNTCDGGYFRLFFNNDPILQSVGVQTTICQVFKDLSGFLPSNVPNNSINIYCFAQISSAVFAEASTFFLFPANPTFSNQGIIDGLVYKSITSGSDPYLSIPTTYSSNNSSIANNFYHGYLMVNSVPQFVIPSVSFHSDLFSLPGQTVVDLYSIVLHEVMHMLGFRSLIDANGFSIMGQSNNVFARYDQFLKNSGGSPLIGPQVSACPNSAITFTAQLPSGFTNTTGCITNSTTCSTAVQYSSSNTNVKVYTPNCWQPLSSLSHLEDLCTTSSCTPIAPLGCVPTPSTPGAHNMYFAMASSMSVSALGCYVKRYIKKEEKMVLCDLGYTTSSTYLSASGALIDGSSNSHFYGPSCIPSATLVGINDGLVNNIYTYSTTGNSLSISTLSLLANDTPSTGVSASCVQIIYTNSVTQASAVLSGTNIVVNATAGSGLVIFKYYPTNGVVTGNATYVYVYFMSGNCNQVNICNMIQNGGFENINSSSTCGGTVSTANPIINCWKNHDGNPSVISRTCTSAGNIFNLGVNTLGSGPAIMNSFNGSPNDHVVALHHSPSNGFFTQSIKSNLSSPLQALSAYKISFMVANVTSTATGYNDISNPSPVVITIASAPVLNFAPSSPFPSTLNIIAQFTIAASNTWTQISQAFTFTSTGNLSHSAILIGINSNDTQNLGILTNSTGVMCYLDEFFLVPQPHPNFALPITPICGNGSLIDLDAFTSNPTIGVFSGPGVSFSGGTYNFNYPSSPLPPGNYPIAYSYTTSGGCVNTQYSFISVSTNTNLFSLSPANLCVNPYTLNVGILLSDVNYFLGTVFSVNSATISNPTTYTFIPGSTYTLSAVNTSTSLNLCNATASTIVGAHSPPSLSLYGINVIPFATTQTLCSGFPVTMFATSTGSVSTWYPGNSATNNIVVTPTTSTIYTFAAYNYSGCPVTQTFAINVYTNCCFSSFSAPAFSGSSLATSLNGPQMILNDITIPPNSAAALTGGEFLMAQTSKIIVSNNATLTIDGAHLYSCTDNLWQGIVVQNGGYLVTAPTVTSNLIEDAVVAIDISSHTNTIGTILTASNTIFNKNYTSINISNYNASLSSYPFIIHSNVFTCRTLSTTTTAWPQTGTVSAATNSAADLRYTSTGTLGLASPYLSQGFTITTLKNPYTTQNSNNAIKLDNVGLTSGNNFFGPSIGNLSSNKFNLFDAHIGFIDAVNSNLDLVNNTYQNTQRYNNAGGIAIKHTITAGTNFKLDLGIGITSVNNANRFWNCYYGIEGSKIYRFSIQYALFRSTQSSTVSPSVLQVGNRAINLPTNRFQYYMRYNEFTNISNCINMPITASWYNPCGNCISYGIYAANIAVLQNTFAATSGAIPLGNNFLNKALDIKCTNQTGWTTAPDYTASTLGAIGAMIQYNTLDKVFRGIYVEGMKGFPTQITDNTVNLASDNVFNIDQHAIHLANSLNANNQYAQSILSANTLSGTATSSASIVKTLVYSANNLGLLSPSVTCNNLFNCYQGFVFTGNNGQTVWAGNVMEPLGRGLNLITNGEIGQQGGPTFSNANKWKNTWSGAHTYVGNNCIPSLSKLYVKNIAGYLPTTNLSFIGGQDYASSGAINIINSSYNDYSCIGIPNAKPYLLPNEGDYESEEALYVAKIAAYRFLHFNDSVVGSAIEYEDFYDNLSNSTMDKFMQMEELLYEGNSDDAKSINDAISYDVSELNSVEVNYNNFYRIYANFIANEADESLQPGDSASLIDLTLMCPETDGACVYQARALYNYIYHTTLDYNDCLTESARPGKQTEAARDQKITDETWSATLYPNPACDQVTIITNIQNEDITVMITDLSGRTVLQAGLKTIDFASILHFSITNGAYLFTITNTRNEKIIQKLLIYR
jgi:hypothetical protein